MREKDEGVNYLKYKVSREGKSSVQSREGK